MNRIIGNVFNQHFFLSRDGVAANLPFVINMLKGNVQNIDFSGDRKKHKLYYVNANTYEISDYGQAKPPEKAPEDSIAIIPFIGVITKADQECGPSGTDTKKKLLERCGANPNIKGVILYMSTPGGEAFASLDMYKSIVDFKNKFKKTVDAYVDDYACSGGQYISAACDHIYCSDELSQVGSIGVVTHILDEIKTLENDGIIVHEIYADESSEKNIEVREALKGNEKPLKERATTLVSRFIADVKAGRPNIKTEVTDPFKGKTLFAKEALKIGLIDGIGSMQLAVKHINSINSNNNQQTNSSMKISWKSGWTAFASLFPDKKDGDELTTTEIDKMNSELTDSKTSVDDLTKQLADANLAKTNAEAAQKKAEDELKAANNLVKTTQDSLVAAESQLTSVVTSLDAMDNSVKEAKTTNEKLTAITALLAAKPGVKPSGVKSEEDKNQAADGVDWDAMNALPHMQ